MTGERVPECPPLILWWWNVATLLAYVWVWASGPLWSIGVAFAWVAPFVLLFRMYDDHADVGYGAKVASMVGLALFGVGVLVAMVFGAIGAWS